MGKNRNGTFSTESAKSGRYGFLRELSEDGSHYKVEEIYRDNEISEIYGGTNEIQRMVIARQIFGKALVG